MGVSLVKAHNAVAFGAENNDAEKIAIAEFDHYIMEFLRAEKIIEQLPFTKPADLKTRGPIREWRETQVSLAQVEGIPMSKRIEIRQEAYAFGKLGLNHPEYADAAQMHKEMQANKALAASPS